MKAPPRHRPIINIINKKIHIKYRILSTVSWYIGCEEALWGAKAPRPFSRSKHPHWCSVEVILGHEAVLFGAQGPPFALSGSYLNVIRWLT